MQASKAHKAWEMPRGCALKKDIHKSARRAVPALHIAQPLQGLLEALVCHLSFRPNQSYQPHLLSALTGMLTFFIEPGSSKRAELASLGNIMHHA